MPSYWPTFTGAPGEFNPAARLDLFEGTVVSADPGTYCVEISPSSASQTPGMQGYLISNILSNALGFKEAVLPTIGSKVLCYRRDLTSCYVFGIIPDISRNLSTTTKEHSALSVRSVLGQGDATVDLANTTLVQGVISKQHIINANRPTDVVDGEYTLSNDFGVLLGLFQEFAVLKGSDLAQIQAFMLDDLVRIVSHNFQHQTALGETSIVHDGKEIYLESEFTHDVKESVGVVNNGSSGGAIEAFVDVKVGKKTDKEDFYALQENKQKVVARLKTYLGKLGDFLQIMLVRPADTDGVNTLDTKQKPDTGLANLFVGVDGGIHVRSLKGIFLEKTNWIRVPNRTKSPEDPEGDDASELEFKHRKAFEFDSTYSADSQPFMYFLQLRDYLTYMQEDVAYSRFVSHEKDFKVNAEPTLEEGISDINSVDPETGVKYEKRTAGVYLMPNGGISLRDAWGSAIVLEGGNVYIQPAKDFIMQPMRNLVAKVGQFVSIAAKKDIDISSSQAGFRLKTEKAQYLYSDKSGIVLHSNTTTPQTTASPKPNEGDQALEDTCGIVLLSPKGQVATFANEIVDRATTNAVYHAAKFLGLQSDSMMIIKAGTTFDHYDAENGQPGQAGAPMLLVVSDDKRIDYSKGLALSLTEKTAIILAKDRLIVGKEGQTYGVASVGEIKIPVEGIIPEDEAEDIFEDFKEISEDSEPRKRTSVFTKDSKFDDIDFRFLDSNKYSLQKNQDAIPMTLAQMEDVLRQNNSYSAWSEIEIKNSFPYPGKTNEDFLLTAINNGVQFTQGDLYNLPKLENTVFKLQSLENIFENYKTL